MELKNGANGQDGVNGLYLAAMVFAHHARGAYQQHTGQKKRLKNNDSLLIKMALKEKWRYPEWQKKGCPMGTPFAVTDAGLIGLRTSGRNGSPHGEDTTFRKAFYNPRSAVWHCAR